MFLRGVGTDLALFAHASTRFCTAVFVVTRKCQRIAKLTLDTLSAKDIIAGVAVAVEACLFFEGRECILFYKIGSANAVLKRITASLQSFAIGWTRENQKIQIGTLGSADSTGTWKRQARVP